MIRDYVKEIVKIIRSTKDADKLKDLLSDYHEKDIAEAITQLSGQERAKLYNILDIQTVAEIFSYIDDVQKYLEELTIDKAAKVVSYMDADDAVDVLDDLSENKKNEIVNNLDEVTGKDVRKLLSYEEDEIGSWMTNNYVSITDDLTIRGAMSELVRQAGKHDNISTIYVVDKDGKFAGTIELKDLIIARENDNLSDIISSSYPYVFEKEKVSDCIEKITEYEEDSIPVLTMEGRIAGIVTSTDIVEMVDDAMGDDYAKLAGYKSVNKLHSIYLGKEEQKIDLNYITELYGEKTNVDIEVNGALKDKARKNFKGTIDFKTGSKKAKGKENEYCTLLSDTSYSKALPMLLCTEDDVEGEHSTATGKVDDNELFYIMTRGISEKEAKKMIVKAKFNSVIQGIKEETVQNLILEEVDRRLD